MTQQERDEVLRLIKEAYPYSDTPIVSTLEGFQNLLTALHKLISSMEVK